MLPHLLCSSPVLMPFAAVQERLRSRFVYNVFERNLDYFTEIQVSSTMVADHLPDRYYTELMRLGR